EPEENQHAAPSQPTPPHDARHDVCPVDPVGSRRPDVCIVPRLVRLDKPRGRDGPPGPFDEIPAGPSRGFRPHDPPLRLQPRSLDVTWGEARALSGLLAHKEKNGREEALSLRASGFR